MSDPRGAAPFERLHDGSMVRKAECHHVEFAARGRLQQDGADKQPLSHKCSSEQILSRASVVSGVSGLSRTGGMLELE